MLSKCESVGKALFPSLTAAQLAQVYPFKSDALFKGNIGNLEKLCIELTMEDVIALGERDVFVVGSFAKLKHLSLELNMEEEPHDLALGQMLSSIPLEIAPSLQRLDLCLSYFPYKNELLEAFKSSTLATKSIVYLSISGVSFNYTEAIKLVKWLPLLNQLKIEPEAYFEELERADSSEQMDVDWTRGKRRGLLELKVEHVLKYLTIMNPPYMAFKDCLLFALKLAEECANVVKCSWSWHGCTQEMILKAISSPMFSKHSQRLQNIEWRDTR